MAPIMAQERFQRKKLHLKTVKNGEFQCKG